ncbi:MAG: DNA repair protein RadA [Wolinella sp.]
MSTAKNLKKKSVLFECQHCGFQSLKWLGKCSQCGAWESFIELNDRQIESLKSIQPISQNSSKPTPITEIEQENVMKYSSCEEELDIVLGGGIVPGGLYLVGGSPGVGKSTLLLKMAGNLAKALKQILYVSGEESMGQIRARAERLGVLSERLFLLNEIELERIINAIDSHRFELVVIDSIQTLYSERVSSAPGSVSQVREVTFELMRLAKERGIAIFIIGHITKEGSIAGPRVLEHMVDSVLYFEGDPSRELRMLRGFKNRFGTTSEVGIFEMTQGGLVSAKDASRLFFKKRTPQAGSALTVVMEGSRALVLEVQALVGESSFGAPKRVATGFDTNRLNMLLALLERKLEIPLNRYDVFINIVGGIKIAETAADLAVIAAVVSSFRNRPLNNTTVFIGEVSLTGDIREGNRIDTRLKEAISQGFERAIVSQKPQQNIGIKCFVVSEVTKIIEWM